MIVLAISSFIASFFCWPVSVTGTMLEELSKQTNKQTSKGKPRKRNRLDSDVRCMPHLFLGSFCFHRRDDHAVHQIFLVFEFTKRVLGAIRFCHVHVPTSHYYESSERESARQHEWGSLLPNREGTGGLPAVRRIPLRMSKTPLEIPQSEFIKLTQHKTPKWMSHQYYVQLWAAFGKYLLYGCAYRQKCVKITN